VAGQRRHREVDKLLDRVRPVGGVGQLRDGEIEPKLGTAKQGWR
jgi:hypothetical protein